jgi:hypothetical protein
MGWSHARNLDVGQALDAEPAAMKMLIFFLVPWLGLGVISLIALLWSLRAGGGSYFALESDDSDCSAFRQFDMSRSLRRCVSSIVQDS